MPENRPSEASLVRAAKAGDEKAFAALVQLHLPALRARVRYALRAVPEVDPDDVVQEALVRAYQGMSLFDERHPFAPFLFGIARFSALRRIGRPNREVSVCWSDEETLPIGSLAEDMPSPLQGIAGVDRFPRPDATVDARARFLVMLSILLAFGGYPHQVLAFGYSVMIWGRPKTERSRPARERLRPDKAPISGSPDRVVQDLSAQLLDVLSQGFHAELGARSRLQPRDLDDAFRVLSFRLGLLGRELFSRDAASRAQFQALLPARVGDTRLGDYFGRDPRRSIADWSKSVKERTRRRLMGEAERDRSKIPLPPSEEVSADVSRGGAVTDPPNV